MNGKGIPKTLGFHGTIIPDGFHVCPLNTMPSWEMSRVSWDAESKVHEGGIQRKLVSAKTISCRRWCGFSNQNGARMSCTGSRKK